MWRRLGGALVVVAVSVMACVASGVAAGAAGPALRSDAATATFILTDGCVQTALQVAAFDDISKDGGTSAASSRAFVSVYQADLCTAPVTVLVDASGVVDLTGAEFLVDQNLHAASLDIVGGVALLDQVSQQTLQVSVQLAWTASGAPDGFARPVLDGTPCDFPGDYELQNNTFQDAEATGSVSDGTVDYLDTLPLAYATIYTSRARSLDC
jgi:hypothetical protein